MSMEHTPEDKQVTPEALKWAIMNFIEQTTVFYYQTERLTKGPEWPRPKNPRLAFEMSKATINACLQQVGGIDHFYHEADGTHHIVRFAAWNGVDPQEDGKHLWTVIERNVPQPLSVGTDAIDEMRKSILEQLSA